MNETITEKDILETPMGAFSLVDTQVEDVELRLCVEVGTPAIWEERQDFILRMAKRAFAKAGKPDAEMTCSYPVYHEAFVDDVGEEIPAGYRVFITA